MSADNPQQERADEVEAYGTVTHPPGTITVTVVIPRELPPDVKDYVRGLAVAMRDAGALVEVKVRESD